MIQLISQNGLWLVTEMMAICNKGNVEIKRIKLEVVYTVILKPSDIVVCRNLYSWSLKLRVYIE